MDLYYLWITISSFVTIIWIIWCFVTCMDVIINIIDSYKNRYNSDEDDYKHLLDDIPERKARLLEIAKKLESICASVDIENVMKDFMVSLYKDKDFADVSFALVRGDGTGVFYDDKGKETIEDRGNKPEFLRVMMNPEKRPIILHSCYVTKAQKAFLFISTSVRLGKRKEWHVLQMNIPLE